MLFLRNHLPTNRFYPESINYPNPPSAIYQSQSELRYNINSKSVSIDPQLTITQSTNKIKSYLIWSMFNICCCCICLGCLECLACYYSYMTKGLSRRGDSQGALNASNKARIINIITTVIVIIIIFFYIIYGVVNSNV
jgi:heme/copper-type cytochrome/quinol oxidase subunit 2